VCEEMWARLGHRELLVRASWPAFDAEAAKEDEIELAVQVNGRVRGRITVPADASEELVRARALEAVAEHIEGRKVVKVVVVKGRLVSVVVQ
jgi:leucyl-tRNA synthetase